MGTHRKRNGDTPAEVRVIFVDRNVPNYRVIFVDRNVPNNKERGHTSIKSKSLGSEECPQLNVKEED
ncbi:MAG: hypothetical protein K6T65_15410 [Peptococcaceae bacterium]|nr:hypothetical protein [Peptococcaceae bacterium]